MTTESSTNGEDPRPPGASGAGVKDLLREHLRKVPDPVRAHGAWVYLALSTLAGVLSGVGRGPIPALLAGVGFAGVFLCASAAAMSFRRMRWGRLAMGLILASAAPLGALALGADPAFLVYGAVAVFPALLAGYVGERKGFQSGEALALAVAALVAAAPAAACAGGASSRTSWLLLGLLAPFFAWRALVLRGRLVGQKHLKRQDLRRAGWREASFGLVWTVLVVALVHVV